MLRAARWTLHVQELFIILKQKGAAMTPFDIDALVSRWMAVELEKTEELRDTIHFTAEDREFMTDLAVDRYEDAEWQKSRDPMYLAPEADAILQAAGVPLLDHDTRAFKRLCRKLQLANLNILGIEVERWQSFYKTPSQVESSPSAIPNGKPSPPFSIVVAKYLAENPKAKRTAGPVKKEFEKYLATIGGDRPIADITKAEGRKYREDLIQVRKVALGTVAQRIHTISGCFTWAQKMGYVPDGWPNPMQGLAPSKKECAKTMQPRRPFTTEELGVVFSSPNFSKQRGLHPARYWITLLCLYQLCRREEAAQLTLADIGEKEGIPYITITDLGDGEQTKQSMKTPGSKRVIPIHSSLIALGFLEYVQSMRKGKHARLFPQLTLEGFRYADPIGKWFAGHLDKVGLSQPELVMHSLRYGIHYLQNLGCPQDVAEMLTGHTASSVHNKYEHREWTKLSRLRDGLEKMQFPAVLDALRKSL
jgi:integrase